jgi:X-Pro dipeptidyl-peptidase
MRLSLTLLAVLWLAAPAGAAEVTEIHRVPTVDGAQVSVEIRRDDAAPPGPVILTYSPYNTLSEPAPTADALGDRYVEQGYVRAVGDVLGTRNSTGCWDYGGPKEQQSGVDLVEWLAAQPWSNGKVAMIGTSYDGTTANMVAARGARGLAAIVPQAAISRWYGYAYTNGVRHLGNSQEPTDEGFDTPLAFDLGFGRTPPTDPGSIDALPARLNPCDSAEHTQRGYSDQPDYDAFWRERDYRTDYAVPTFVVHGWQDFNVHQEEGLELYDALDAAPWKGLYVWQAPHASPGGEFPDLLDAFFARFLEGLEAWPPPGTGDVELRLGRGDDGGTLGGPGGGDASYSDSATTTEESAAQDPAAERSWLAYASRPLEADLRIAGAPALELFVEAGRDHGHVTPTLFDVDPSGAAVPITRGFLDLRYRESLEAAKPAPVGERVRVALRLKPQDWVVRQGHRLVLEVASSNTAWAVPDDPGLSLRVLGEGSRLLLPVVGAAPPGATTPAAPLPTTRAARTLTVRAKRAGGRRVRVRGRAPAGSRVRVALVRGKKVATKRTVRATGGRFAVVLRARRAGRHRVVASLATRDGVVRRRTKPFKLR